MEKATATELTDVLYYKPSIGKRARLRDCALVTNFLFDKKNFFVTRHGNYYFVCIPYNGELVELTCHNAMEGDRKVLVGEVSSAFRKDYLKNAMNQEKIDLFIQDPVTYKKKYPKKNP